MTLREARKQIEKLENEIERLLADKELIQKFTEPQAVDTTKIMTTGGSRSDKFLNYVMLDDEKEINKKLDIAYGRKNNLEQWVENELKILNKYNELEKQIVYYKEDYVPKNKFQTTWWYIANQVNASESTCRRIYKKYKKQRNIEN